MSKIISVIKDEFNSYSKKIKITLYILFAIEIGFIISAIQIFFIGLGYTGMNNIFPWGQWIVGDLSLIVLGGGAFFTSFVLYIFRRDELQPIINSAILIGLLCYIFTFIFLIFDIGQPLRAFFGFAYPNWGEHLMPQSMLTEVVFCISFYTGVLVVEFIPITLKHKVLDKYPVIHAIGHYMHKLMWIMAAIGTFFSIFHQGSLGGLYGVLYAKPGWFRPHMFYLSILSAFAAGPCFILFCTWIAGKVIKKEVVPKSTYFSLSRIAGAMFIIYFIFRIWDIYKLHSHYVPAANRSYFDLWGGYYGIWLLVIELALCFIPVIFLNIKKLREKETFMVAGIGSAVIGMIMSRFNLVIHGFSIPNLPWRAFTSYLPTVQEWFVLFGVFATMILLFMWAAKYLPIFPHLEKEQHE